MEYSKGWKLSNGKKVFLRYILRDKETLIEQRRFLTLDDFAIFCDSELKLPVENFKLSRDRRFLFELPNHYLEDCGR